MNEALDAFLQYLSKGKRYSPNTTEAYRSDMEQFRDYFVQQVAEPKTVSWTVTSEIAAPVAASYCIVRVVITSWS